MDDLELAEEIANAYAELLAFARQRQMSATALAELEHRAELAKVALHGARGARGLNPLTGEAA